MPVRASAAPRQVAGLRFLPKLGEEGPAPLHLFLSFVGSGTDPHRHVWGGHRAHQGHEHKRKPQVNSLIQDIWLDTGGQRKLEARWRPRPTTSLPVLFPGQSTSAELRASGRGRERARRPGRWKTREGALDWKEGVGLLYTTTRTFFSFPELILAFFPMWRKWTCIATAVRFRALRRILVS